MKRLSKVEREIKEKLKKHAKRYNKSYPGEMVHFAPNAYKTKKQAAHAIIHLL